MVTISARSTNIYKIYKLYFFRILQHFVTKICKMVDRDKMVDRCCVCEELSVDGHTGVLLGKWPMVTY